MAYKRSRTTSSRRWVKRAKKSSRKNGWRLSRMPAKRQLIHNFKRTFQLFNHDPCGNGVVFRATGFSLDQLPNYTEFTNLYDNFRIKAVRLKFFYDVDGIVDPGRGCGWLYSCTDETDVVPPSTLDEMYQYRTFRVTSLAKCNERHTRYFTPKLSMQIYRSSLTTGYTTPKRNPWVSTTDPSTIHFGFKYATDAQGLGDEAALKCICTMYFQCKSVK